MYCYRTISFQSGYSYNNLDQSFIGNAVVLPVNTVNEEFAYYMGKGIDGVDRMSDGNCRGKGR